MSTTQAAFVKKVAFFTGCLSEIGQMQVTVAIAGTLGLHRILVIRFLLREQALADPQQLVLQRIKAGASEWEDNFGHVQCHGETRHRLFP